MILDIICAIVVVWGFVIGYKKGIIFSVFFFLSLLIGVLLSLKFSQLISQKLLEWFTINPQWLPIISFILIFIVSVFLITLLAKMLEGVLKMLMLNFINRIIGALFWIGIGLFLLSTFYWYANQYGLINEQTIAASKTFEFVSLVFPFTIEHIGIVIPTFQNILDQINDLIQNTNL
jgi:membrane protein required for colicin V production